jgi:hypothetical protein
MSLNGVADLYPNTLSGLSTFNANQILINGVDISTIYVPFINSPSDVDLASKNLTTTGRVQATVLKLPSLTQSSTKFLQLDANKEVISTDLATTFVVYTGATNNLDMGVYRVFTTAVPSFNNELVNKLYVDTTFPNFGYLSANYLTQANASIIYAPIASPTFTGTVSGITSSMVGLGNVDNTSDLNKPVSTATQTALNLKADLASPTFTGTVSGITSSMVGLGNVDNTSDLNKPVSTATQTALNLKSDLASPTFTGTVTLPSVTFTSAPASGTGTLLAINGSNQLITTTSTLNQTATSTNATHYLTFVASSATGAFTPLVFSQIMCNPSIGLIEVNNIKVTSRNQGGSQTALLACDSSGNIIDGYLTQASSSTNADYNIIFTQYAGTGIFNALNEQTGSLTYNPSTLVLKTSKLRITSVPTGTQQYLLAVDSSGNVIQGTGGGGVPTQINPTPTNTGTLYPVFLTSTAGGASTTYVESDGSLNYDPANNILNLPRLTATTQIQSPIYSNGSGQTVTINASGGLIAGNQVIVQMQGTTYYYFDQNAFYLTQPVNNVISSILNDLYLQWPSGKLLSFNNWATFDNTGLYMASTRKIQAQNFETQPAQDLTLNVPTATNFINFNFNGTNVAKSTFEGFWIPADGSKSYYCTDTAPYNATYSYNRLFAVGGTSYNDFYNIFQFRVYSGISPLSGLSNVMKLTTTGMTISKSSSSHATLENYELVVGDNSSSLNFSGKILVRGTSTTSGTAPSIDFTSYHNHLTPSASIECVNHPFTWAGQINVLVKAGSGGQSGALVRQISIDDDEGLVLYNSSGAGNQPQITFAGNGIPNIKAKGAGYNWFIGNIQCGYFDTITASGHWRISTNLAQKLILCSGGQNTLQCGNGGLGHYPVEIYGYRTVTGSYWQYTGGGATWGGVFTSFNVGLYVQYTISADGGYLLASDERIKTDIKPAESGSLEVIKTIPIKSHAYIDSFINGCPTAYNVIAQDIQKFYPEAITITDGFIPDMYVKCRWIHVNDKQIEINVPKPHTVIVGDKVKLILEDSTHKEAIVTAIKDQNTFAVEKWDEFKMEISDELFVYGKNVKDFLRVDKIKLGVLALAGVKELNKIVETQQAKIEEQSSAINTLTESMKFLTEHLAKLTNAFNEIVKEK